MAQVAEEVGFDPGSLRAARSRLLYHDRIFCSRLLRSTTLVTGPPSRISDGQPRASGHVTEPWFHAHKCSVLLHAAELCCVVM